MQSEQVFVIKKLTLGLVATASALALTASAFSNWFTAASAENSCSCDGLSPSTRNVLIQPEPVLRARLTDALRLRAETKELTTNLETFVAANNLKVEHAKAAPPAEGQNGYELEASKNGEPVPMSQKDYADLLARYKELLAQYNEHRQAMQAHAVNFHGDSSSSSSSPNPGITDGVSRQMPGVTVLGGNAAQSSPATSYAPTNSQSGAPLTPEERFLKMTPPVYKPLSLQVADNCQAMQEEEQSLYQEENAVWNAVRALVISRKDFPTSLLAGRWTETEQAASVFQAHCLNFDRTAFNKHLALTQRSHDLAHLAMNDGSQTELTRVYGESQRMTAVGNMGMSRADSHSKIAMGLLNELRLIKPNGASESSPVRSSTFNSPASTDSAKPEVDNATIDKEYAEVQELYAQIQQARPLVKK